MTGRPARLLTATAAVLLLVGGAATVASAGVAPPSGDDISFGVSEATTDVRSFYGAPTPLPKGAPGTLIRAQPVVAPPGARAWRVLYHSRDVAGDDIAVSGVVIAPDGDPPAGGRPVVAWAHATTGVADACAPSRSATPADGIPWLGELLDRGYVVTATDYAGLGTDGVHPYLVGASEGKSILDSIRAARHLPTDANRRAVVYGHSQGGHATLFAGELARSYAPDLAVKGVAPGAAVAAPEEFVDDTVDGTLGYLVMGGLGYQDAYPDLAKHPLITAATAPRAEMALHVCALEVLAAFDLVDPGSIFDRASARTVKAWERRLRENAAGLRRSVPVLYWQGGADTLTRVDSADAYVARACRAGTVVDYRVYDGANHISVLTAAHDDLMAFIDGVLTGHRPEGTCPARADANR